MPRFLIPFKDTSLISHLKKIQEEYIYFCRNGGTCVNTYSGYFCQCTDKWEGDTCELDVNECQRFQNVPDLGCQNGATCINLPGQKWSKYVNLCT